MSRQQAGHEDHAASLHDRHEGRGGWHGQPGRKERQERGPARRHSDEMHGDRHLGHQYAGFEHGGARRNVRPTDLATHRIQEGHGAPVGQELVAAHQVGQIGAAGREHGLRPLPHGPALDSPGGCAGERTGGGAEPGRQQAGGEDPVARAHAAGQEQPARLYLIGQERVHRGGQGGGGHRDSFSVRVARVTAWRAPDRGYPYPRGYYGPGSEATALAHVSRGRVAELGDLLQKCGMTVVFSRQYPRLPSLLSRDRRP
jgi:hypothetical protein